MGGRKETVDGYSSRGWETGNTRKPSPSQGNRTIALSERLLRRILKRAGLKFPRFPEGDCCRAIDWLARLARRMKRPSLAVILPGIRTLAAYFPPCRAAANRRPGKLTSPL